MKEVILETYLESVAHSIFGERSEDCDERIDFEVWLNARFRQESVANQKLHAFTYIRIVASGYSDNIVGHALILENSIEIKALGLASSELAS